MKVIWNKRARTNLDAIRRYIYQNNQIAAKQVALRIIKATERLADMPRMGRVGRNEKTRELVIPSLPFIVPYRIKGHEIRILRVLHTTMKWPDDL